MGVFDILKKFPLTIIIYRRVQNALLPEICKGRFEKVRLKCDDGIIERRYLSMKRKSGKVDIPMPPLPSVYMKNSGESTISLLQLDLNSYYPVSYEQGKLVVELPQKLPLVEGLDEKGQPLLDEQGNIKYVRDALGEIMYETRLVKQSLMDSNIMMNEGKIENIPYAMSHKTFDREQWLSQELVLAQSLYRSRNFFEKYGGIIIMVVGGMIIFMMVYIGVTEFAKMVDKLIQATVAISQNINSTYMAQISNAQQGATQIVNRPPF